MNFFDPIVYLRIHPKQTNRTKIDEDRKQSSNKHQDVTLPSDHFFNDINAGTTSLVDDMEAGTSFLLKAGERI